MLAQIRRAGHRHAPHRAHLARHQARAVERADAQRKVDAAVDQVHVAVVEDEFDLDVRIAHQECRHHRRHVAAPEDRRRRHPQQAARAGLLVLADGRVVVGQQAARALGQALPFAGGSQAARAACEQARADALFQRSQLPRHRRGRAVQLVRRSRHAARLEDGQEDLQFIQTVHAYCDK